MYRGLAAKRGLQGHDPKTAHTCSSGSGRMCHGVPSHCERHSFNPLAAIMAPIQLVHLRGIGATCKASLLLQVNA